MLPHFKIMPAISDATIIRFMNDGEIECSVERPFLPKRVSFATTIGQSLYTLDDNVVSLRRLTWQNWKMDPLPRRNFREVFQGQNYQNGRPFWYIYNNTGLNTIQIFPAPDQALAQVPPGTEWTTPSINAGFIVEYFVVSDNINYVLPDFIKRQLLKIYVAKRVYNLEGPSQSLVMAKYFAAKWDLKKKEFFTLLDALYGEPRKLVTSQIISNNYFPGSPVLPITQFGISVEPGYD